MFEVPVVGFILLAVWNVTAKLAGWAAGSFVFCRRKAFSEVGGFSLNLYAAEEIEFFQKAEVVGKTKQDEVDDPHRSPTYEFQSKAPPL